MPSQLLNRLKKFFDQGLPGDPHSKRPIDLVMAAKGKPRNHPLLPPAQQDPDKPGKHDLSFRHWWGGNFGVQMQKNTTAIYGSNRVSGANTICIHETSGWTSYSAENMVSKFLCVPERDVWIDPKPGPPPVLGAWIVQRNASSEGPQYYVEGNGTVVTTLGDFDLSGGPYITSHAGQLNSSSIGIENGDLGDYTDKIDSQGHTIPDIRPSDNANGPYWFRLSNTPADTWDFLLFALIHPLSAPDLGLVWFASQGTGQAIPNYQGSGDTDQIATRYSSWRNMIFTERDYRSLALLSRLLVEQYGIPRNFCALPYGKIDSDGNDVEKIRKLILAEERQDMIARKLNITSDDVKNRTDKYLALIHRGTGVVWNQFFGFKATGNHNIPYLPELPTYRGFIAHVMAGSHDCPGPMFDWHRFAREVWDWWWYPFDLRLDTTVAFPARRAYMRARGDTILREYYYDAGGANSDYTKVAQKYIDLTVQDASDLQGIHSHFAVASSTPVYAMANGVIVAARLPKPTTTANPAFILVRHEIFHQADQTTKAINYDLPPAVAWSLTTYLACDHFDFTKCTTDNPDWLNRLLMRFTECKLAVAYKNAHGSASATDKLTSAWNYQPATTDGHLPLTGANIAADAVDYLRMVTDLGAGKFTLFPLENDPNITPVRVILGDFLGPCGNLPSNAAGVQVEVFSRDSLPIINAPSGPIKWAQEDWWKKANETSRLDGDPRNSLPQGTAYYYNITDVLDWINQVTWASEWPKYEVVDSAGAFVSQPADRALNRPRTRVGL